MEIQLSASNPTTVPFEIERGINDLLMMPLYGVAPVRRQSLLLALLKEELEYASSRNPRLRNYVEHWPVELSRARTLELLPYLPVGVFKENPPFSLVSPGEVKLTLKSSATTGQTPSRIALDAPTAKRMVKSVVRIMRDFIGDERRPYLVIDTPESLTPQAERTARAAAIEALRSFATETVPCLCANDEGGEFLDLEKLLDYAGKWKEREVLVYGFTYIIWTCLVQPLQAKGMTLGLPNVHVLHSGGWKRLEQQAVSRETFRRSVASVFGCSTGRVIDYYGMIENVGVVYPDCEFGNKHVPAFADVIVRNPLTLDSVESGQIGLVQVCSVLPTSFPGFLVLTEDMAEIIGRDGCPCGRRGKYFRFVQRVPKAEARGCGNVENTVGRHEREAFDACVT